MGMHGSEVLMRRAFVFMSLFAMVAMLAPMAAEAAPVVRYTPSELILGQQVQIALEGAPARVGDDVVLQEKISGSWRRIQRKMIRSDGGATFWERPDTFGIHWYRIVVPADGRQGSLVGHGQPIPVRRWRFLSDLDPAATGGPAGTPTAGPVVINDRTFSRSLRYSAAAQPSTTDWTLPARCVEFRSVLGLASGSDPGSEVELSLYLDGVEQDLDWAQPTMGVGDENAVSGIELVGRTTLRLEHTETVAEASPAFGNARILCAS